MPKNLNEVIANKLKKEQRSEESYKAAVEENARISSFLQESINSMNEGDLGGFSKKKVLEAAKYTLKAKAYGIDVTGMKIDDSPIFYNIENKKSRWYRRRKRINEKADILIKRATARAEQERNKARGNLINPEDAEDNLIVMNNAPVEIQKEKESEIKMQGTITAINEDAYQDDENYMAHLETTQAANCLNDILNDNQILETAQQTINAVNAQPIDDNYDQLLNKKMEYFDKVLNEEKLPSADELKTTIIKNGEDKIKALPEGWEKNKKKIIQRTNDLIATMDRLYKEVAAGTLSPDVLKVFLRTHIMGHMSGTERKLYESMVQRQGAPKATKEEDEAYRNVLAEIGDYRRSGKPPLPYVSFQGTGTPSNMLTKKRVKPQPKDPNEAQRLALMKGDHFVHFHSRDSQNATEGVNRYYVTAKAGKQTKMLEAWLKTLKDKPEMGEKLYYKMSCDLVNDRKDNIVIYVTKEADTKDIEDFLDSFRKNCEEGVLETKDKGLPSTVAMEGEEGITKASEFNTGKIHTELIGFKVFTDPLADQALHALEPKRKNYPGLKKPTYSYNSYISTALLYSARILCKNEHLDPAKVMNTIKEDPQMKRKYLKLFSDFMKLGDTDPETMMRKMKA